MNKATWIRTGGAALVAAAILTAYSPVRAGPPEKPRVINLQSFGKKPGVRGGELRTFIGGPKDIRLMVIQSAARLVAYDQHFNIVPDILQGMTVEDNKSFTLHLRPGHRWSDGTPFTSEDFRYYWEDIANHPELSPGRLPRALLADGNRPTFEVIDRHTVRYTWPTANPHFLPGLAGSRPVYIYAPAHYLKAFHADHRNAAELEAIVDKARVRSWASLHTRTARQYRQSNPDLPTLQPWRNTTAPPSQRFVFQRNDYFHRVDENGVQLPYLDTVILNVSAPSLIPAKTGSGESDLQARYLRLDNFSFLKENAERNGFQVYLWSTGQGSWIAILPNLNANDPVWRNLFRDARFRRALSLGINRFGINQTIYYGLASESGNTVLPASPLYRQKYADAWAAYDPDMANQLLDEAGLDKRALDGTRLLPDGRRADITIDTSGESSEEADVLQLIAEYWREIGINIFPRPTQRTILRRRIANGDTLMSVWSGLNRGLATAAMDPEDLVPVSAAQGNWPKWGRYYESQGVSGEKPDLPEVVHLLELYEEWSDAGDLAAQERIWHDMLDIFTDQVFTIGVVSGTKQPVVVRNGLRNMPREGIYAFEPTGYLGYQMPDTFWWDEESR